MIVSRELRSAMQAALAYAIALLAGCGSPSHRGLEGEAQTTTDEAPETPSTVVEPVPVRPVEIRGPGVPQGPNGVAQGVQIEPNTLRIVPVHSHALLQPESRALDRLRERLTRGDRQLAEGAISDEEVRFAEALAYHPDTEGEAPATPTSLPEMWQGVESVVLVVLYPPARSGTSSFAGGAGAVMLLRPPSAVPVFRMRTSPPTHRRWETRAPFEGSTYAGHIERMLEGLGPSEEDR